MNCSSLVVVVWGEVEGSAGCIVGGGSVLFSTGAVGCKVG